MPHDQAHCGQVVEYQAAQPPKVGGARAVVFIYAMEGLDIMAFLANANSLITYFTGYMNFGLTKSATTLTNYMGTSFMLALLGGFISDTYLTRFMTCVLFGCIEVAGYIVLAMQAHFDSLRPVPCKGLAAINIDQCEAATSSQSAILYSGLYLVALGASGIKAALPSLGADQFDERGDPKALSSFFNWFLFSLTTGAIVGLTFLVWIITNKGWAWGFGISAAALLVSVVIINLGKSLYRIKVPEGRGPLTRILQVLVAAGRNWRLPVPNKDDELYELHTKQAAQTEILRRTNEFRWLDRAAIIKDSDGTSSSQRSGPWHICTVTQVEETKIILRMLPIILSTIFMNTCLAQLQTFSIQQGVTMDSSLFGFDVPASSLPVIPFLFIVLLVPLYDRVVVPFARRLTGIPTGIKLLQRIGIGLVLSVISMTIAGAVETRRKRMAIEHDMVDSMGQLPMGVFWLSFQYAVFGAADMFTLAGLLEFFYAESSVGMKSLGTAISWCSLACGYFLSSVVVEVVNKASGGWLASNNLNRDKLNYFYWLLAGLSVLNFGFYLLCSSRYKYKNVKFESVADDEEVTGMAGVGKGGDERCKKLSLGTKT